MKLEIRNAFDRVFLTVEVDKANRWVHTNWMGYLTEENIKAGALAYAKVVQENGLSCVLNDTRQVVGGWDHSLDWVINEWAPQAARAGIKKFALITNPSSFAETSASAFYENLKAFEVQIFHTVGEAQNWLRQFSLRDSQRLRQF
ncbi:STAS/SEC14 domain-containing protein [Pontibacter sp. CAU 1760]